MPAWSRGSPITDCTSGFKCYRADVLRALNLERIRSNGYVFQVETCFRAWRLGYRLVDFPIIFYERRSGQSKLNLGIAFEAVYRIACLGLERLLKRRLSAPQPTIEHLAPHPPRSAEDRQLR